MNEQMRWTNNLVDEWMFWIYEANGWDEWMWLMN